MSQPGDPGQAGTYDPKKGGKFTPKKYVPPVTDRDHAKKTKGQKPKPPRPQPK